MGLALTSRNLDSALKRIGELNEVLENIVIIMNRQLDPAEYEWCFDDGNEKTIELLEGKFDEIRKLIDGVTK